MYTRTNKISKQPATTTCNATENHRPVFVSSTRQPKACYKPLKALVGRRNKDGGRPSYLKKACSRSRSEINQNMCLPNSLTPI